MTIYKDYDRLLRILGIFQLEQVKQNLGNTIHTFVENEAIDCYVSLLSLLSLSSLYWVSLQIYEEADQLHRTRTNVPSCFQ